MMMVPSMKKSIFWKEDEHGNGNYWSLSFCILSFLVLAQFHNSYSSAKRNAVFSRYSKEMAWSGMEIFTTELSCFSQFLFSFCLGILGILVWFGHTFRDFLD